MAEALRIEHLSKTFPGQRALDDVTVEVAASEVHALVGQNGSGKSTIIKILAGYHQPDPGGSAWVDGAALTLGDGPAAAGAGIRFVHQDLGLVGTVSTVENLALTIGYRTGLGRRINWRRERAAASAALAALGAPDIDVRAPVASLPAAQRTIVAIARALIGWEDGARLLVLDEPTATLPNDDVRRLFDVIHRLKDRGVAILYVSHHLDEVFELANRVTVLRDGRKVGTVEVSRLDHDALVELIVGHHVEQATSSEGIAGRAALSVRGLRGGTVKGVDFDVHEGEIVGLAGITGSGREDVIGLITGQRPRDDGRVLIADDEVANYQPRSAMNAGAAFVPSDRAVRGAVGTMSVRENLTLTDLSRHVQGGRLRRNREIAEAVDWIQRLSIKTTSSEALITSLSGGNQQKVMFGKALRLTPRVLLLDEPTQGIDVGAKEQIHRLVDAAAAIEGVATLVASTDTDELVRLCHRVLVLVDGRITATLTGDAIAPHHIEHTQLQSTRRAS